MSEQNNDELDAAVAALALADFGERVKAINAVLTGNGGTLAPLRARGEEEMGGPLPPDVEAALVGVEAAWAAFFVAFSAVGD